MTLHAPKINATYEGKFGTLDGNISPYTLNMKWSCLPVSPISLVPTRFGGGGGGDELLAFYCLLQLERKRTSGASIYDVRTDGGRGGQEMQQICRQTVHISRIERGGGKQSCGRHIWNPLSIYQSRERMVATDRAEGHFFAAEMVGNQPDNARAYLSTLSYSY